MMTFLHGVPRHWSCRRNLKKRGEHNSLKTAISAKQSHLLTWKMLPVNRDFFFLHKLPSQKSGFWFAGGKLKFSVRNHRRFSSWLHGWGCGLDLVCQRRSVISGHDLITFQRKLMVSEMVRESRVTSGPWWMADVALCVVRMTGGGELWVQGPYGHQHNKHRGGLRQAVDGIYIPLFKLINSLPNDLGRVSGYNTESPFMRCKSGMRMPRGCADLTN